MRRVEGAEIELHTAIQGELGSNSHMAALEVLRARESGASEGNRRGQSLVVACGAASEVFEKLEGGEVGMAVLPIENSLHGSVAEHLDLLLEHAAIVTGETLLRVRHNVIVPPGVRLAEVRQVMSHPVALSQCRGWLRAHPEIEAVPYYDTAGSVKRVIEGGLREVAGIAPELAAEQYGGEVLVRGIEDHAENYTRFYVLAARRDGEQVEVAGANKMSVAFSVHHRPGSLMEALEGFRAAALNLTKIESRPVPGKPWEYVFFVDLRFEALEQLEQGMGELRRHCQMVKELGRYRAA